jgi:hypothetical protein
VSHNAPYLQPSQERPKGVVERRNVKETVGLHGSEVAASSDFCGLNILPRKP